MPYIKSKHREVLDPLIDKLAEGLVLRSYTDPSPVAFAGLLNYAITKTILCVLDKLFGSQVRYWIIAVVTGVLKNVADEFYRRLASPYEDEAAVDNGDLPEYRAWGRCGS